MLNVCDSISFFPYLVYLSISGKGTRHLHAGLINQVCVLYIIQT